MKFLSSSQIKSLAPSVFATKPKDKVSDRYGFVSTVDLLKTLQDIGFQVRDVQSSGNKEFGTHMLRLAGPDIKGFAPMEIRDEQLMPELLLINSHDTSHAFTLTSGIFRFICTNGLIVADGKQEWVRIQHAGFNRLVFNEGIERIIADMARIWERTEVYAGIEMNEQQQTAFAHAVQTVYNEPELENPLSLIKPRRSQDNHNTLWHLLNRGQENMLHGGLRLRSGHNTRAVRSAAEDLRLNKGIWQLTDNFADLLAA
jgi:hypothetical protein